MGQEKKRRPSAKDAGYTIDPNKVNLAACREGIALHANNIANDISSTVVNNNRILTLRALLNVFEEFNAHMIAEELGNHNENLGFNNVGQHIKDHPGQILYSCEACGPYTASTPVCNKCKIV